MLTINQRFQMEKKTNDKSAFSYGTKTNDKSAFSYGKN